ncbi:hypothetical protein CYL15_16070 [Geobacillus thermodenitrificans]|nr:hypothetical protein [Geobacillus thermodenitrificans]
MTAMGELLGLLMEVVDKQQKEKAHVRARGSKKRTSFVVDLQSCKNPRGSTTLIFVADSLQPSWTNMIDGIFRPCYSEGNMG